MEIYKVISDYPNYEISNLGNVRNIKTSHILNGVKGKDGYKRVDLYKDGGRKLFLVHRLVADVFIPNPENKRTVNHIDGNKTNNCVSNLEWATDSENIKHAYDAGLYSHHGGGVPKQRVRCIETGQEFDSQLQASKYFGCPQGSIRSSILTGGRVLKQFHFELV